jgi:hypothetical protein
MLRKENAVCMVNPTGTSPPNITGPEVLREVSANYCVADVFHEPAHDAKCGTDRTSRPASAETDRSAADPCVFGTGLSCIVCKFGEPIAMRRAGIAV